MRLLKSHPDRDPHPTPPHAPVCIQSITLNQDPAPETIYRDPPPPSALTENHPPSPRTTPTKPDHNETNLDKSGLPRTQNATIPSPQRQIRPISPKFAPKSLIADP